MRRYVEDEVKEMALTVEGARNHYGSLTTGCNRFLYRPISTSQTQTSCLGRPRGIDLVDYLFAPRSLREFLGSRPDSPRHLEATSG